MKILTQDTDICLVHWISKEVTLKNDPGGILDRVLGLLEQKPSLAVCSQKECSGRNIKGSENWSGRDYRARFGRWAHTTGTPGLAARGIAWVYNTDIWSAYSHCPPLTLQ